VNPISRQVRRNFKRRIQKRLAGPILVPRLDPMLTARNIHYEIADRTRGLSCGGIGVVHQIARTVGLIDALDRNVHLLKVHLPYHESDHILNIAYNVMTGGTCLEDLELRRNNEVYMDALGARRIPDPTTAGDFCRRFVSDEQIITMMQAINDVRLKVWKQQPAEFFAKATLHADGTIARTYGECKQGMDISYDGQWGYHALLISLANTREPLYLVNRSGNRPSAGKFKGDAENSKGMRPITRPSSSSLADPACGTWTPVPVPPSAPSARISRRSLPQLVR